MFICFLGGVEPNKQPPHTPAASNKQPSGRIPVPGMGRRATGTNLQVSPDLRRDPLDLNTRTLVDTKFFVRGLLTDPSATRSCRIDPVGRRNVFVQTSATQLSFARSAANPKTDARAHRAVHTRQCLSVPRPVAAHTGPDNLGRFAACVRGHAIETFVCGFGALSESMHILAAPEHPKRASCTYNVWVRQARRNNTQQ
jgi:hypothetical protein